MVKERESRLPEIIPSDIYLPSILIATGAAFSGYGLAVNNGSLAAIGIALFAAGVGGIGSVVEHLPYHRR